MAILGVALDSRHRAEFPTDCSHLVHELYERAGFPYEYASSSDLYAGVSEFRQVAKPQPGDLAVWRGHAGIVVNPAQHSFFSTLGSGPGVDSYDSAYWKQRGRPRFFRYVKPAPKGVLSASSLRTASLKPAALDHTAPREAPADDSVADDGAENSPSESVPSAKFEEHQAVTATTPRVAVINFVRPKSDQVSAAFLAACKDWEQSIGGRDLFNSAQALVVFDKFEVRKVHITGGQDWVEVQIEEMVSLTATQADVHKRSERQRWPLRRRDHASWELTPPTNTIYRPQHLAARVLAHELANLTENAPDAAGRTQEKAGLARLLSVLLSK